MADTRQRIVFAGTPEFAAVHLRGLLDSGHQVIAVYTQPDRPAGRGRKLTPSPVKELARARGVPVYQPASLRNAEAQETLASLEADLMVVVAYGLILPQSVLDTPRQGCLNVHASLLPRWRGAAPIQRAIEAGDEQTGVCIMQMDAGLDTGPILAERSCPIGPQTTAADLHDQLAELAVPLLLEVLADLEGALSGARPQDDQGACYAGKIAKSEAQIDWRRSAAELDRCIRAFNPFPVCYTTLEGELIKVWRARIVSRAPAVEPPGTLLRAGTEGLLVQCGAGQLLLQHLQLAGGKPLEVAQLLNARSDLFRPGSRFGSPAAEA